jgi:hypothetical protein
VNIVKGVAAFCGYWMMLFLPIVIFEISIGLALLWGFCSFVLTGLILIAADERNSR